MRRPMVTTINAASALGIDAPEHELPARNAMQK